MLTNVESIISKSNLMRQISYWAKNHVWQSRLLIVVIYILLNAAGIFTGKLLKELNVVIPGFCFAACVVSTIVLWVWYPTKKANPNVSSGTLYFRRKSFEFLIGCVTFLMIVYAGNNWQYLSLASSPAKASKLVPHEKDSVSQENVLVRNFITELQSKDISKLSSKEKLRIIKNQVKIIKEDEGTTKGEKIVYTILSVLLAIALLMGLTVLSCSIACGGAEALSLIVAFGGSFLIIFFLVRLINSINKPGERKERRKQRIIKREERRQSAVVQ